MKKVFLLFAVFFGISELVSAQRNSGTSLSVGPELHFATGNFADGWSLGLGGSVQAEHYFNDNVSGTAFFGYNNFTGKTVDRSLNTKNKNYSILPLRVGARYYMLESFHVGPQLGVGFLSVGNISQTALAYSLQAGYNFNTKKGRAVDATIKYDGYAKSGGSISAFGFRVAYNLFSIK